jgi:hypothetical protein
MKNLPENWVPEKNSEIDTEFAVEPELDVFQTRDNQQIAQIGQPNKEQSITWIWFHFMLSRQLRNVRKYMGFYTRLEDCLATECPNFKRTRQGDWPLDTPCNSTSRVDL